MEGPRPLAYESLKMVIQYMEPNLRFKLSNRVPSIVSTEKVVPLEINKLEFNPYEVIVNKTTYKLGTYRQYPPGVEGLREHRRANANGGVPYDLDQYGFPNYSQENVRTPGDVVIKDTQIGHRRDILTEEQALNLLKRMEVLQWIWAKKLGYGVKPLNVNHPHYFLVGQYIHAYSVNEIQHEIDSLASALTPFYCRHNDTPSQYSTMVQFTIINPKMTREISRKLDGFHVTKLYNVQKELTTRLFGNRKGNVLVKQLNIGFCPNDAAQMVVRLPPDFRIKVREMCIFENVAAVCDSLQSLVHNSSYPLERIRVYNTHLRTSAHPTVFTAKVLRFSENSTFGGEMTEFLQFDNQWIYVPKNLFTPDEHITLLRSWIENRRKVGTCFVSKVAEAAKIIGIFEKCKEELNGLDTGKRLVKVPMSKSSEIDIYYKFLKNRDKWKLTIRVVAV